MKNKNDIFDLVDEVIERKTREEMMRRINEMYNDKHFIYSPIFSPVHRKKEKLSMQYIKALILMLLWVVSWVALIYVSCK